MDFRYSRTGFAATLALRTGVDDGVAAAAPTSALSCDEIEAARKPKHQDKRRRRTIESKVMTGFAPTALARTGLFPKNRPARTNECVLMSYKNAVSLAKLQSLRSEFGAQL